MNNHNNQPIPFVDTQPILIWLTLDEIGLIENRASESGYELTSDFLRECLGFEKLKQGN